MSIFLINFASTKKEISVMIKLYSYPSYGTAITNTSNDKMYLFNGDNSKYMVVSSSEMEELSQIFLFQAKKKGLIEISPFFLINLIHYPLVHNLLMYQ